MPGPKRKRIPPATLELILQRCRRQCCMCFGLKGLRVPTEGQIAHLDRDPSNCAIDNLAYLCLECHAAYDTKNNRTVSYTATELRTYRDQLLKAIGHDQTVWTITIRAHESDYDRVSRAVQQAYELIRATSAAVAKHEERP